MAFYYAFTHQTYGDILQSKVKQIRYGYSTHSSKFEVYGCSSQMCLMTIGKSPDCEQQH